MPNVLPELIIIKNACICNIKSYQMQNTAYLPQIHAVYKNIYCTYLH